MATTKRLMTRLPEATEIMRRLMTVNDAPELCFEFYSGIVRNAGVALNSMGLVNMLLMAINDYDGQHNSSVVTATLAMSVPDYIKALVDDAAFVKEAMEYNNLIGIANAAQQHFN